MATAHNLQASAVLLSSAPEPPATEDRGGTAGQAVLGEERGEWSGVWSPPHHTIYPDLHGSR